MRMLFYLVVGLVLLVLSWPWIIDYILLASVLIVTTLQIRMAWRVFSRHR